MAPDGEDADAGGEEVMGKRRRLGKLVHRKWQRVPFENSEFPEIVRDWADLMIASSAAVPFVVFFWVCSAWGSSCCELSCFSLCLVSWVSIRHFCFVRFHLFSWYAGYAVIWVSIWKIGLFGFLFWRRAVSWCKKIGFGFCFQNWQVSDGSFWCYRYFFGAKWRKFSFGVYLAWDFGAIDTEWFALYRETPGEHNRDNHLL